MELVLYMGFAEGLNFVFKSYTFGCIAEAIQYGSLDIEGWLG